MNHPKSIVNQILIDYKTIRLHIVVIPIEEEKLY